MKDMTLEQAKELAVEKWGYQARAYIKNGACYVSSRYYTICGVGATFRAAFRLAEEDSK